MKQFFSVSSETYRNERHSEGTQTKNIYILTWSEFRLQDQKWVTNHTNFIPINVGTALRQIGQISAQAVCVRNALIFLVWSHNRLDCHILLLLITFFSASEDKYHKTEEVFQTGEWRKACVDAQGLRPRLLCLSPGGAEVGREKKSLGKGKKCLSPWTFAATCQFLVNSAILLVY